MPLKAFRSVPQDIVEWARYFTALIITPDPGTITDDTFANRSPASVIGRSAVTGGPPSDIVAGADRRVLIRRAGALQFDGIEVADLPASLATDSEVAAADAVVTAAAASALAAHVAAVDPHPVYTTAAELAAAITAHEAASDPHPQYLTQTEGDARYLQLTLTLTNAVDDAAAATAGVAVGRLYRNGSVVMIRVT